MEAYAEHELGFSKAHRNGSCNESKTDMLAEAAASARDVCSLNLHMLAGAATP